MKTLLITHVAHIGEDTNKVENMIAHLEESRQAEEEEEEAKNY